MRQALRSSFTCTCCLAIALLAAPLLSHAQAAAGPGKELHGVSGVAADPAQAGSAAQEKRLAALEEQNGKLKDSIASAQTAGDNAWMLVSAALVLMMSGPGLALFYG